MFDYKKFIKTLLVRSDMTAVDLAKKLKVTRTEIYRELNRDVRLSSFMRTVKALGYDVYVGRKGEEHIKVE